MNSNLKHTFDDDGNGNCDTCPLPQNHPRHQVTRPSIAELTTAVTVNQTATSQAAGQAAALRAGTLRANIHRWISTRPHGATTDEVEIHLDRSHQSVSSAVNALAQSGHLVPLVQDGAEVRRDTRTGNPATVYVVASARVGAA